EELPSEVHTLHLSLHKQFRQQRLLQQPLIRKRGIQELERRHLSHQGSVDAGKVRAQTGSPPRAAHFPNKATRMPPLGASTSSSVVDVAQSWRVRVGGNNLTGAGAVLSNGDIVLVGAMGHRGEESLRGSFAPGSTGAR
ncbi:unnamed protein product, partial [Ascophyllum nodosum]